jgi:hypothetical protein
VAPRLPPGPTRQTLALSPVFSRESFVCLQYDTYLCTTFCSWDWPVCASIGTVCTQLVSSIPPFATDIHRFVLAGLVWRITKCPHLSYYHRRWSRAVSTEAQETAEASAYRRDGDIAFSDRRFGSLECCSAGNFVLLEECHDWNLDIFCVQRSSQSRT